MPPTSDEHAKAWATSAAEKVRCCTPTPRRMVQATTVPCPPPSSAPSSSACWPACPSAWRGTTWSGCWCSWASPWSWPARQPGRPRCLLSQAASVGCLCTEHRAGCSEQTTFPALANSVPGLTYPCLTLTLNPCPCLAFGPKPHTCALPVGYR